MSGRNGEPSEINRQGVPAPSRVGGPLSGPLDLHPTPYLPYPGRSERNVERLYLPYLSGGELRDSEAPHVAS